MQALYQKQGRSSQFKSMQERDQWIKKEIEQLETTAAVKASSHDELEAQTQQLSSQLMDLSQVTHTCLPFKGFPPGMQWCRTLPLSAGKARNIILILQWCRQVIHRVWQICTWSVQKGCCSKRYLTVA